MDLKAALTDEEWHASQKSRKTRARKVKLPLLLDSDSPEEGDLQRDVPVSFDPAHRKYDWRKVESTFVTHNNPAGREQVDDFFEAVSSA